MGGGDGWEEERMGGGDGSEEERMGGGEDGRRRGWEEERTARHNFCWLLIVPATCECISGTDLHTQFYVLPH